MAMCEGVITSESPDGERTGASGLVGRDQRVNRGDWVSRRRLYHQPRSDDSDPLERAIAVESVTAGHLRVRPFGVDGGRGAREGDRHDVVVDAMDDEHRAAHLV